MNTHTLINYNPRDVLGVKARTHINAINKLMSQQTLTAEEINSLDYKWLFHPQIVHSVLNNNHITYTQTILKWWRYSPLITHFMEDDWLLNKETIINIISWKMNTNAYEKFRDLDDAIGMCEGIETRRPYAEVKTQLYDERRHEDAWYMEHTGGHKRMWAVGGYAFPLMMQFMDIVFDRVHLRHTMEKRNEDEDYRREMEEMWRHLEPLSIIQSVRKKNRIEKRELTNPLRPQQKYNPMKAVRITTKQECKFVDEMLKLDESGVIFDSILRVISGTQSQGK